MLLRVLQVLRVDVDHLDALEDLLGHQEAEEPMVKGKIPKQEDQQVLHPSKLEYLPKTAHIDDFLACRYFNDHLHL